MTLEERSRRQQIIGVVNMVYDICDKHNIQPTPEGLSTAIYNWMRDEIAPKEVLTGSVDIGVAIDPYNTCLICDAQITRSQTYCNRCNETIENDQRPPLTEGWVYDYGRKDFIKKGNK